MKPRPIWGGASFPPRPSNQAQTPALATPRLSRDVSSSTSCPMSSTLFGVISFRFHTAIETPPRFRERRILHERPSGPGRERDLIRSIVVVSWGQVRASPSRRRSGRAVTPLRRPNRQDDEVGAASQAQAGTHGRRSVDAQPGNMAKRRPRSASSGSPGLTESATSIRPRATAPSPRSAAGCRQCRRFARNCFWSPRTIPARRER